MEASVVDPLVLAIAFKLSHETSGPLYSVAIEQALNGKLSSRGVLWSLSRWTASGCMKVESIPGGPADAREITYINTQGVAALVQAAMPKSAVAEYLAGRIPADVAIEG